MRKDDCVAVDKEFLTCNQQMKKLRYKKIDCGNRAVKEAFGWQGTRYEAFTFC